MLTKQEWESLFHVIFSFRSEGAGDKTIADGNLVQKDYEAKGSAESMRGDFNAGKRGN